jgi:hypothetical protein
VVDFPKEIARKNDENDDWLCFVAYKIWEERDELKRDLFTS